MSFLYDLFFIFIFIFIMINGINTGTCLLAFFSDYALLFLNDTVDEESE